MLTFVSCQLKHNCTMYEFPTQNLQTDRWCIHICLFATLWTHVCHIYFVKLQTAFFCLCWDQTELLYSVRY